MVKEKCRQLWRIWWFIALLPLLALSFEFGQLVPSANAKSSATIYGTLDYDYKLASINTLTTNTLTTTPLDCGLAWQLVPSLNIGSGINHLYAVAAVSANDIWVADDYWSGIGYQTQIQHWNGSQWSIVPSPNIGSGQNSLLGLDAVSANDVWAVGTYYNAVPNLNQTLIHHWDGSQWSIVPSPNSGSGLNYLWGVSAISSNDVWAVGYYMNSSVWRTLTEHWDGSAWSTVPSPNNGSSDNQLLTVAAISSNDVWAVGHYSAGVDRTLIEHWDGSAWSIISSPNNGGSYNYLNGVTAISASDLWAVGDYLGGNGYQTLSEHWNGSQWSIVSSPNNGSYNYLQAVSAFSSSDVWAVGFAERGPTQTLIEHWDGSTWSIISSPSVSAADNSLYGVAAVSANDVWAVGYYDNGNTQTLLERYHDSGRPCPTNTPNPPVSTTSRTFPETGKTVSGKFLLYWDANGGLAQQGFPISSEMQERSDTDGKMYKVQYFERAVFEYHPENAPPYDVLLSLLGGFAYNQRYPQGAPNQNALPSDARIFRETGYGISGRFLKYWEAHGGLAQQGFPLSNEFTEVSALNYRSYTVQYFERAVFEYHPENAPPYDVLLSQLGTLQYNRKYP